MTPFLLLLMYSAIIIFIVSTSTLLYGPPHIRGVLRNDDVRPSFPLPVPSVRARRSRTEDRGNSYLVEVFFLVRVTDIRISGSEVTRSH